MKKTTAKASVKPNDIFQEARKVFSGSYVDMLRDKGHDFLEQEGAGSYVEDSEGKRYLDCYASAGTFNLGRRNESIAESFKKSIYETDQGNFVMPSDYKALLARRLSEFIPGNLDCVLFGVTRGESMDAACKLARGFTSRPEFVTVDGGLYGECGFALSLSQRAGKEQFGGLIPGVKTVPFGDVDAARKAVSSRTAAFVMEPIQAENNCRMADSGYYRQIRSLCDASGAKLIFDETQSGFGRTGTRFFYEHIGVMPDILIIGEAITGGMFPMTAMVFTTELKHFFDIHPLIHLCTFGGHDLGCLVAMAALDEYDRLEPWVNVAGLGDRLMKDLSALAAKHAGKLVSVAGKGLLISIRLATDDLAKKFCASARHGGLLVNTGRVDTTTVLIRPSLLIGAEETGRIVGIMAKTVEEI
ncbi:MAG: aminotransferase class III-fold pyridoxal phosphate-dependent enzyme [Desulfobacterota bacterium]|jgi:acetylornithine/succinyldiaminopimelate/putrescine aminotransferase|nr:aminotransferase class III-fold pyridoxal phosphate-dependent enzyme [Thermodesulfobacteriota bacterium]